MKRFEIPYIKIILLFTLNLAIFSAESTGQKTENAVIQPTAARMMPLAHKALISQLYKNKNGLYAVGERGHIFHSPGGKSEDFVQLKSPARQYLSAITGDGGKRLWAVGHDSLILHSSNGGESWIIQHFKPKWNLPPYGDFFIPLFDIVHVGGDELVAVGAYGMYLRTTDGGNHWEKVSIDEEGPHFFDVDRSPSGTLFLAGEFGAVIRCPSSGKDPERLETEVDGTFFGIEVISDDEWFGYGLRGRIYHYRSGEMKTVPNESKAAVFGSLPHKGGVTFFGTDGFLLNFSDGKSTPKSLPERVGITDGFSDGKKLILSTTEGFRALDW